MIIFLSYLHLFRSLARNEQGTPLLLLASLLGMVLPPTIPPIGEGVGIT
jgi:hypothetical protein